VPLLPAGLPQPLSAWQHFVLDDNQDHRHHRRQLGRPRSVDPANPRGARGGAAQHLV